jgi:hypothetical protein
VTSLGKEVLPLRVFFGGENSTTWPLKKRGCEPYKVFFEKNSSRWPKFERRKTFEIARFRFQVLAGDIFVPLSNCCVIPRGI